MNEITKAAIKDITKAILGLIPGSALYSQVATSSALEAVARLTSAEKDLVATNTQSIFDLLTREAKSLSPEDPGRATSAAYDILLTVKAAELDADKLIDCALHPENVYQFLLKHEPKEHSYASAGRLQIYHKYLSRFSELVVEAASKSPAVQGKALGRILQTLQKQTHQPPDPTDITPGAPDEPPE